mmetsp:Transcript_66491/g.187297  ORF Transcript_66491/g.187297 Transcript_66491/m.187297 type:complete len:308 (-) Transcript_66491:690-1613(-)
MAPDSAPEFCDAKGTLPVDTACLEEAIRGPCLERSLRMLREVARPAPGALSEALAPLLHRGPRGGRGQRGRQGRREQQGGEVEARDEGHRHVERPCRLDPPAVCGIPRQPAEERQPEGGHELADRGHRALHEAQLVFCHQLALDRYDHGDAQHQWPGEEPEQHTQVPHLGARGPQQREDGRGHHAYLEHAHLPDASNQWAQCDRKHGQHRDPSNEGEHQGVGTLDPHVAVHIEGAQDGVPGPTQSAQRKNGRHAEDEIIPCQHPERDVRDLEEAAAILRGGRGRLRKGEEEVKEFQHYGDQGHCKCP